MTTGITRPEALANTKIDFEKAMFRHRLLLWYKKHGRALPWRVDWQKSKDPYRVWLSEIMLQQTVIKAMIPVYQRFLAELPTLPHVVAASEDDVRRLCRGLGYYRRFGLFKKAAGLIPTKADGTLKWPTDSLTWKALPGIGDYTSAAVCSIAFDEPIAVVDGNVERVLCRLFDVRLPPNLPALKKSFKKLANELLEAKAPGDFNQAVMELGQTVCTMTKPSCAECPLSEFCLAFKRGSQALAPQAKLKKAYQNLELALVIPTHNKNVGLTQRGEQDRFLKHSWGFEVLPQVQLGDFIFLGQIRHNITHHRITAKIYLRNDLNAKSSLKWLKPEAVEESLVANLDRKAWQLYLRKTSKPAKTSIKEYRTSAS